MHNNQPATPTFGYAAHAAKLAADAKHLSLALSEEQSRAILAGQADRVLLDLARREVERLTAERGARRVAIEREIENLLALDRELDERYAPSIAQLEAQCVELRRQESEIADRAQALTLEMRRAKDAPAERRGVLRRELAEILSAEFAAEQAAGISTPIEATPVQVVRHRRVF